MKNQKTVFQYLLTIPGFGHTRAKQLLTSLGIALSTRMKGITLDTYGKTNKPTVISSKKNKAKLYLDQAKLT
jgi:ribosomal protein S13